MTTTAFSRRTKALTIIPLAALSGAWTVALVTTSAGASGDDAVTPLPGGATVPTAAIEAPASVPQPGVIAPGVPVGGADQVVSSASSGGIPSAAIAAYQRGAQIINAADKTCNIPWELIAAIGRVESNHGRYDGNVLNDDGVATPGIYGIRLDGKNNTQAIPDTDAGELDKDTVFDRAVGPMQFIPSTWAVVKVDADGDGERNPQDIDDAALAAGVYLCSGKENLSGRKGQETAVYRYNHSKDYVNLVLRLMEAYQEGEYTAVPSSSYGGSMFSPSYSSTITERRSVAAAKKRANHSSSNTGSNGIGGGGGGTAPSTDTSGPGTSDPSQPAPQTPSSPQGPAKPGLPTLTKAPEVIKSTVKKPVEQVTKTVEETLTRAEATAQCLASGISKLDVVGLANCVERLLK